MSLLIAISVILALFTGWLKYTTYEGTDVSTDYTEKRVNLYHEQRSYAQLSNQVEKKTGHALTESYVRQLLRPSEATHIHKLVSLKQFYLNPTVVYLRTYPIEGIVEQRVEFPEDVDVIRVRTKAGDVLLYSMDRLSLETRGMTLKVNGVVIGIATTSDYQRIPALVIIER